MLVRTLLVGATLLTGLSGGCSSWWGSSDRDDIARADADRTSRNTTAPTYNNSNTRSGASGSSYSNTSGMEANASNNGSPSASAPGTWQGSDRDRMERDWRERDGAAASARGTVAGGATSESARSERLPSGSQLEAWTNSHGGRAGQGGNWNSNSSSNAGSTSGSNSGASGDRSNMNPSNARNWADGAGDRGYNDRLSQSNWTNAGWNDREVRMIQDRELPEAVRAGFVRDSNGSTLSETGKGMWRGSEAYSARVVRNGQNYRIISDSSGNIIAMYRVD